jgi:hypothetical protein
MKLLVLFALAALTVACADLARPNPIRVANGSGIDLNAQAAVRPETFVELLGPDGKKFTVPRLNPPGHPSAGMPVRPGDLPARAGKDGR